MGVGTLSRFVLPAVFTMTSGCFLGYVDSKSAPNPTPGSKANSGPSFTALAYSSVATAIKARARRLNHPSPRLSRIERPARIRAPRRHLRCLARWRAVSVCVHAYAARARTDAGLQTSCNSGFDGECGAIGSECGAIGIKCGDAFRERIDRRCQGVSRNRARVVVPFVVATGLALAAACRGLTRCCCSNRRPHARGSPKSARTSRSTRPPSRSSSARHRLLARAARRP